VLAEVDPAVDQRLPWPQQLTILAQRLRCILEDHPGIAGLLKTRAPLTPHSLALAEAFLAALHEAGLPEHRSALAYHLIQDYVLGFAVSDRTSTGEQRVQDTATRQRLQIFLRSLPADRFPVLASLGEQVWINDRDERFAEGLRTLLDGLQARQPGRDQPDR
jgi:Tetracyclin repressor-like, C-terminal domain